ncbi:MAG TPA: GHMP kinase [Methanomicrobiales archaeon]|nr:GHMP kinase [Methanomicrobiales archaeon]
MEGAAVAWSPGHISGYFRRIQGATPRDTGSRGAGIVIGEGVTARAVRSRTPVVRMVLPEMPPWGDRVPLIETAMERLGVSAEVTTESPLPAGAGFGLSAAALLSSISALSALFDLALPDREIASLAHEIEVLHRTGLGDVAACQGGGIECRKGPGIGAEIERIPAPGAVLLAVSLGPIPTPGILGDPARMEAIGRAFPGRCPRDLDDLLYLSRSFAEASGLVTPRVREILGACDRAGVPASMTMLGEGVFALGGDAPRVLAPFGRVYRLSVSPRGFSAGEVVR